MTKSAKQTQTNTNKHNARKTTIEVRFSIIRYCASEWGEDGEAFVALTSAAKMSISSGNILSAAEDIR